MKEPRAKGVTACRQIYPRPEQAERPDKSKVLMVDFPETEEASFAERRKELERKLEWLFDETDRLKRENEQLKRENKELREEVTLLRLAQESDWPEVLAETEDLPAALPQEAVDFFSALPRSLNFAVYFRIADEHGINSATAKNYLLHFIQEGLMVQKGHRIEKSEQAASQSEQGRRPQDNPS